VVDSACTLARRLDLRSTAHRPRVVVSARPCRPRDAYDAWCVAL
jgi:hypothetical protein